MDKREGNRNEMKKPSRLLLLTALLLAALWMPVWANSAEPPAIVIIVNGAPEDLTLTLQTEAAASKAGIIRKPIETYFTFYTREIPGTGDYQLLAEGGGYSHVISVRAPEKTYNNIYTLNLAQGTLTEGKLPLRDALLVGLRLSLTLLLEGAVFLAAGYRSPGSWRAILGVNLLTQGALNLWLTGLMPLAGYAVLTLIFGEFFVFLAELVSLPLLVREKSRWRTAGTVLLANGLSLAAGGWLITRLPL